VKRLETGCIYIRKPAWTGYVWFFIDRCAWEEYLEAAQHEFAVLFFGEERSDAHSVLGYAGFLGQARSDHGPLRR
jgi:hypothetical protein